MEQNLMRNLMRAAGGARRHHSHSGQHPHKKGMGFGHILDLISENGQSQQSIAEALGIRPQSLSEAVSVLEERGFVCRKTSEQDKRKTLVFITEEGILHRQQMAQHRKQHAEKYFSVLTDAEKTQLLHLLKKINLAADKDGETL